mgnify:CR=1 FL=1
MALKARIAQAEFGAGVGDGLARIGQREHAAAPDRLLEIGRQRDRRQLCRRIGRDADAAGQ